MYSRKSEGGLQQDLVYKLLAATAQRYWPNISPFWVVTGTIIPGEYVIATEATSFHPIKSSMENLLHAKYLNIIAKQYFDKELPGYTGSCQGREKYVK